MLRMAILYALRAFKFVKFHSEHLDSKKAQIWITLWRKAPYQMSALMKLKYRSSSLLTPHS